jgi:hypothetical protein
MDFGVLLVAMVLAIPVLAIIGGITAGILKTRGQQRIVELAHRERLAAIERGIDPDQLPPIPVVENDLTAILKAMQRTPRQAALHQAQGFLITGVILLAAGLGLSVMLLLLSPDADKAWAAGLMPIFIGLALLLSSVIVRRGAPREDDGPQGRHAQ